MLFPNKNVLKHTTKHTNVNQQIIKKKILCINKEELQCTFFRFPETLTAVRSDFPTLKSTDVIPPSSLKAMCEGAKPITHNLQFKVTK